MSEKIQAALIAAVELEKAIAQAESLINEIFDAAPELDEAQTVDIYGKIIRTQKQLIVLGYAFRGLESQLCDLLKQQDKGYEHC